MSTTNSASLSARLRAGLARLFRGAPHFPGKQNVAAFLNQKLTDNTADAQALVTLRMADGSRLCLDLRSETEWPAYWTGRYDRPMLDLLLNWLPARAVVLDVGANIGFYSVPLGRRLRQVQGQLLAIEPVTSNFDRLVHNLALNRLENIVTSLRLALSDREGTALLQRDARNQAATGNAAVVGPGWGQPNASAPMTTLDHLAETEKISTCHLIKVDIEGGEYRCLQGGQSFLRRTRPLIVCEINSFWMERLGWSYAEFLELARSLNYEPYRLCRGRLVRDERQPDVCEDIILVPQDVPSPVHIVPC